MIGPNDINLPFFAYGVFRKGELGFLSISDLVSRVVEPCSVTGSLLLRDGLPIIDPAGRSNVPGSLISFREGLNGEAYDRIDRLEPQRQYRWEETTTAKSVRCNYLIGRSHIKVVCQRMKDGMDETIRFSPPLWRWSTRVWRPTRILTRI